MNISHLLLFLFCIVNVVSSTSLIKTLPNFDGELPFTLETGYIGVGVNEEVQLFYYLVHSQGTPSEDPILVWLSGGPGYSSLYAFFYESGPVEFNYTAYDGVNFDTLKLNAKKNSWTERMNMIFLDGPVGTGFSYSKTPNSSYTSDFMFADNTYEFLRKFLAMDEHVDFRNNEIYIGGDGYSGNPIPILISDILEGNKLLSSDRWNIISPFVNIKGYVLGNAGADKNTDFNARYTYNNRVSYIPDPLYNEAVQICNGNLFVPDNEACGTIVSTIDELVKNINALSIQEPACPEVTFNVETTKEYYKDVYNGVPRKWCRRYTNYLSEIYLNEESVQNAFQVARPDMEEKTYPWEYYNRTVDHVTYTKDAVSVLRFHDSFAKTSDIRGLIYTGDHDVEINFIGTQKWIRSFNWPVSEKWRVWTLESDPNEVAGYTTKFHPNDFELTYATIKGAGHFAPEYMFDECAQMIKRWIHKEDL